MRDPILDVINYCASSFAMRQIKCLWSNHKKIWNGKDM